MNIELKWLLFIVIFLVSLLFVIFMYLVIQKFIENRSNVNQAQKIEEYRPTMYRYLLEGIDSRLLVPSQGSKLKFNALEQLLEQCAAVLDDEEVKLRIHNYAMQYFAERYQKRLIARRWSVRMNTLYLMEKFNMQEMETDVIRALSRKRGLNIVESAQLFKLLAIWGSKHFKPLIQKHHMNISSFQKKMILSHMPDSLFNDAVDDMRKLPRDWQFVIIDIIGIQRKEQYQEFIERLIEDQNDELRIRALKALSQMSLITPKASYVNHSNSSLWEERMAAARLYAAIRHPMYIPCLTQLIADRSWWVRSQAAQALSVYPNGLELLQSISKESEDPYARDIANEWWQKGGGGSNAMA